MANQIDYIAHADWLWYDGKWIAKRFAFAPKYADGNREILIVCPTNESLTRFSYDDVIKNLNTSPLDGFRRDDDRLKTYRVPLDEMNDYLAGDFYNKILKEPEWDDSWEAVIGTYDMATFMELHKFLKDRIVYLGPRWQAENIAAEHAQKLRMNWDEKKWTDI